MLSLLERLIRPQAHGILPLNWSMYSFPSLSRMRTRCTLNSHRRTRVFIYCLVPCLCSRSKYNWASRSSLHASSHLIGLLCWWHQVNQTKWAKSGKHIEGLSKYVLSEGLEIHATMSHGTESLVKFLGVQCMLGHPFQSEHKLLHLIFLPLRSKYGIW